MEKRRSWPSRGGQQNAHRAALKGRKKGAGAGAGSRNGAGSGAVLDRRQNFPSPALRRPFRDVWDEFLALRPPPGAPEGLQNVRQPAAEGGRKMGGPTVLALIPCRLSSKHAPAPRARPRRLGTHAPRRSCTCCAGAEGGVPQHDVYANSWPLPGVTRVRAQGDVRAPALTKNRTTSVTEKSDNKIPAVALRARLGRTPAARCRRQRECAREAAGDSALRSQHRRAATATAHQLGC
jgi:hypothetical protein